MRWERLFDYLEGHGCRCWSERLRTQSSAWLVGHGDYRRWNDALSALPEIVGIDAHFDLPAVSSGGVCADSNALRRALSALKPWRKGPYRLADVYIDSEWRSDFKWDRVKPHLSDLRGRRVLDVGCGNGYHCWRVLEQAPEFVLGIEPSVLFNMQFLAVQNYLCRQELQLAPIGIEDLPPDLKWFDSVFSMGVLYHRRSPIDHLLQLAGLLVAGGELCLETLVIEGDSGRVLLPADRYARMRNVWFIPSARELRGWLQRCGFVDVRIVDESVTGPDEQRVTEWMQFESLQHSLDPRDPSLTVEGLPAPRRAVLIAQKA